MLLGWVDSYVVAVGWAARLAGSHFPDQGLNVDYHSESASPNHWNSQDRSILEAWVHKELDTTERLTLLSEHWQIWVSAGVMAGGYNCQGHLQQEDIWPSDCTSSKPLWFNPTSPEPESVFQQMFTDPWWALGLCQTLEIQDAMRPLPFGTQVSWSKRPPLNKSSESFWQEKATTHQI